MTKKEKKLSREEARELYDDLKKAMERAMGGNPLPVMPSSAPADPKMAKEIAMAIRDGLKGKGVSSPREVAAQSRNPYTAKTAAASTSLSGVSQRPQAPSRSGGRIPHEPRSKHLTAFIFVLTFGMLKAGLDIAEGMGFEEVPNAQASVAAMPRESGPNWSKEEVKVLTALDHRRAELEERSSRLDDREMELGARDQALAVKLVELKELTDRLRTDRDRSDKQKNGQLDQLANVYGSMNPPEAAQLLGQLDVTVALSLIERMPEKRIGQILALMSPERALKITNLLSERTREQL